MMMPNADSKLLIDVILATISVIIQVNKQQQVQAYPVTNKMRYATDSAASPAAYSLGQMLELSASKSSSYYSPGANSYRINRDSSSASRNKKTNKNYHHLMLDEEDKSLLAQFYRQTKERDPFLTINGGSLSTESLWDESGLNGLDALIDHDEPPKTNSNSFQAHSGSGKPDHDDHPTGWRKNYGYHDHQPPPSTTPTISDLRLPNLHGSRVNQPASYSPTLRLLTTYDPANESAVLLQEPGQVQMGNLRGNRIVGATLYTNDKNTPPGVSSKSAHDAIKLHDELLREPPRDGKARVRMYYHRAIHDDKRLYGTGPWKYWGHGWGVEFGFDPKTEATDNSYQKGYTIERAFGRDFCKDKSNCRKPDPNFFEDPRNAGAYSSEQHKAGWIISPTNSETLKVYSGL